MKRQVIVLAILICEVISQFPREAFAIEPAQNDISSLRKISLSAQKFTGITPATNILLSLSTYLILKAKLGGSVRASVKTECLTDLFCGRFAKVDIRLKNSTYNNIPLGNLGVITQGPIKLRYFKHKGQRTGLLTPLVVAVSGEADERQISKALLSDAIASKLRFLKLDLPGLGTQHLQIIEPKVKLANNKIYIDCWLVTVGAAKDTGIKLNISATPQLIKERFIVLKDTSVFSDDIIEPTQFAKFAEDLLNPLIDLGKMDKATHAIRLTNVDIDESKVSFKGNILLVPKQSIQIAGKN